MHSDLRNKMFFAMQFEAEALPDNSFDSIHFCWRSDPLCGIDVAPKRPQEVLKDPKKNLVRMQWDNTRNPYVEFSGGYYWWNLLLSRIYLNNLKEDDRSQASCFPWNRSQHSRLTLSDPAKYDLSSRDIPVWR